MTRWNQARHRARGAPTTSRNCATAWARPRRRCGRFVTARWTPCSSRRQRRRVYTLRSADAPYRALVEQMQEGAVTLTQRARSSTATDGSPTGRARHCRVIGASVDELVDDADRDTFDADCLGRESCGRVSGARPPRLDVPHFSQHRHLDEDEHRTFIVTDMTTFTQVQRESRAKDEFLAMLAHELRNPLGAMRRRPGAGLGEAEPRAGSPDIIDRQVPHMARLMDDLLDVGRVMTGKIAAQYARTYRSGHDESSAPCVAMAARADVTANGGEREPVLVAGDPARLEQVVANLVEMPSSSRRRTAGAVVGRRRRGRRSLLRVAR